MKAYTTRSNALRAAKSAGFTKDQVDIAEHNGGYVWIELISTPEEPVLEDLVLFAPIGAEVPGDVHTYKCPHCEILLGNGVGVHGQDVNGKTVKHDKFEYECLACGGEFGPAIVEAKHVAGKANHFKIEIKNESTTERPCKSVWAIADEMKGARRKDVIAACVEKGIAYNTARTQYQQWYQLNKKG